MRIMPTPVALLGIALLGGCAAAQSSSAAPPLEPDCSFRSASTCWTVAGRFPARRPKSTPSKPDEIRDPSPTAVASNADSSPETRHMPPGDSIGVHKHLPDGSATRCAGLTRLASRTGGRAGTPWNLGRLPGAFGADSVLIRLAAGPLHAADRLAKGPTMEERQSVPGEDVPQGDACPAT